MKLIRNVWVVALASCLLPALVAPAHAEIPALDRVRVLGAARAISGPDFAAAGLVDQDGAPASLAALTGKVTFVLFGFTNCPDVCPLAMERLRELHDAKTLDAKAVRYVMISVDGERDTPDAMKAFLAKYSPEFVGLTAPPAKVKPLAEQFSAAFFKGAHDHHGGYDVAHSPQIFVIDADGKLRAELYGASIDAMTGVANALAAERR